MRIAIISSMVLLASGQAFAGERTARVTAESASIAEPATVELADTEAPACASCGSHGGACNACNAGCPVGPRGAMWVRAEYLGWWVKGAATPPLVTQAPRAQLGAIDEVHTLLYGGDDTLDGYRSGGRIRLGLWLDPCHYNALEGEYLGLGDAVDHFWAGSDGSPTISRPYFDTALNDNTVEKVGYLPLPGTSLLNTGAVSGTVTVDHSSALQSAGARFRHNFCCRSAGDPCGRSVRVDWIAGYRYLRLNEALHIHEDLYSLDPATATGNGTDLGNVAFDVYDQFDARTTFHGGELGLLWQCERRRWSLEVLTKLAIGSNRQQVDINGWTVQNQIGVSGPNAIAVSQITSPIDPNDNIFTGGGLLAQRTNIGTYTRDRASLVPELGVTLGCQLNPRLRATLGYNLIFWTRVLRAAEQIDTQVNPYYIPDEGAPTRLSATNTPVPLTATPQRPAFTFHETTLWAQGFSVGLEATW